MAEFGVGFKVSANVGQFTSGMREAGEAAKGFKKTFNDTLGEGAFGGMAKFLSVGGLATALIRWFSGATESAQAMRDEYAKLGKPLEDSVRSVAAFGDGIDAIKKGISEASITTLSFFTRAGEGFGELVSVALDYYGVLKRGTGENIEGLRAAELAERNLAKARADNSPEKIAAAEKKLQEIRFEGGLKLMDDEAKIGALMVKRYELQQELNATGKETVRYREIEADIEKNATQVLELNAKVKGEQVKAQEEIVKLADEYANAIMEEGDAIDANNQKLKEQAEAQRMAADEAGRMADEQSRAAAAAGAAASAMAPFRGGDQFNDASDETLRGIISKNKAAANRVRNDITKVTPFGNLGTMEASRLEFEAQNAQSVLDARNKLRSNVRMGGVDYARQQYQGDPLMFDQMLQRWVQDTRSQMEISKDGNQLLKDLNDRLLKAGFGK